MTPQELLDKAKSEIETDSKTSQELQQKINNINLKIFANQELVKNLANIDGVIT
jgi:predicted  nucleic acid-binding Zn-ribbon protein